MTSATAPEPAPADGLGSEPDGRVSTLELFFDLVFVFTITQVTQVVDHHPGPLAVAQGALLLTMLFWMYGGFTWLTNAAGSSGAGRRVVVLIAMAALLVCSLCVPRAFDEDGIVFGIAYLVLIVTHAVGFAVFGDAAGRRGIRVVGPINIAGAILLLIAGWTHGAVDYLLWSTTAALFLFALISPIVQGRFQIQVGHFAERHGLMILIVLGESLVSIGSAAAGQRVDGRLIVGVLCGFLATAALWWSYFVGDDEAAVQALGTDPDRRTHIAGVGYDLTHLVMIAGVIGVAAGTRLGLTDLLAPTEPAGAVLIGTGGCLFLLGSAWFRAALGFARAAPRLVAAAAVLVTVAVGRAWGTGQQLAAVAVVVGLAVASGSLAGRGGRQRPGSSVAS